MTTEEREYIAYLNESLCNNNYGLLLYKGDPIAFEIGFNEFMKEKEDEEDEE